MPIASATTAPSAAGPGAARVASGSGPGRLHATATASRREARPPSRHHLEAETRCIDVDERGEASHAPRAPTNRRIAARRRAGARAATRVDGNPSPLAARSSLLVFAFGSLREQSFWSSLAFGSLREHPSGLRSPSARCAKLACYLPTVTSGRSHPRCWWRCRSCWIRTSTASVVLLVHHDGEGSFGVVLNRATEITAGRACARASRSRGTAIPTPRSAGAGRCSRRPAGCSSAKAARSATCRTCARRARPPLRRLARSAAPRRRAAARSRCGSCSAMRVGVRASSRASSQRARGCSRRPTAVSSSTCRSTRCGRTSVRSLGVEPATLVPSRGVH